MRAHRAEAKSALLQLATNQERFYLTNRTYGTMAELVLANLATAVSERGTYTLTIAGANAAGYMATATPTVGANFDMTADVCTSFSITAQGVRTAVPDAATCW
jgi:type IV pilus assembly protein PilE